MKSGTISMHPTRNFGSAGSFYLLSEDYSIVLVLFKSFFRIVINGQAGSLLGFQSISHFNTVKYKNPMHISYRLQFCRMSGLYARDAPNVLHLWYNQRGVKLMYYVTCIM